MLPRSSGKYVTLWRIAAILCAIAVTVALGLYYHYIGRMDVFNVLASALSVLTAIAVVFIWWGQRSERELAELPRRLDVRFKYEGKLVYQPPYANLSHEADARQLAQQIGAQAIGPLEFDATKVEINHIGKQHHDGMKVFTVAATIHLKSQKQADQFKNLPVASEELRPAPAGAATGHLKLFVCSGDGEPPAAGFETMKLDATLDAKSVESTALAVREKLQSVQSAELVIKGPVTLGVALGHVLQHVPCRVEFLQLDQSTKTVEAWWANTKVL